MTATPPGRGPGDGIPEEGTPEYEWLYGAGSPPPSESPNADSGKHRAPPGRTASPPEDATRPVPRQQRPEETRVMPIQPPSQFRSQASPRERRAQLRNEAEDRQVRRVTRPTPPPVAPPPGRGGSRFRPRFRIRYVFLLLLLWLVFLVVVPLVAWNKVSKIDAMPSGNRPGDQPGTTYLLVGSDSRADLTPAQRKQLNTGGDVGQRTDTIMLLHTGSGPNLLMSIPRDSLVPIPGHGTTKINAAYAYGGPQLLIRTIETNTGIRIDNYVEIGFGGFVGLVDAVGGIQICPKEDMVDADANLRIKKGCQDVEGDVALAYARSRHAQQLGDLDRAAHQREVVAAVGKKAISPWSLVNPFRYWQLNMAGADFVAIDDQMGPVAAAQFAMAMTKVNGSDGLTCGVPITDLAVHWDEARSTEMFQHIKADDTAGIGKGLCTPSGLSR
jgi:LCP family protein required for cell wall assembly